MDLIETFAPHLHFHKAESHYLGYPEEFRQNARLVYSPGSDVQNQSWNEKEKKWQSDKEKHPGQWGADWNSVVSKINDEVGASRPPVPARNSPVTRPRDKRCLWRSEDEERGFFLQLKAGYGRGRGGTGSRERCAVFYDIDENALVNGRRYVILVYWFFYIQNWYHFYTHEGDWEHITLYFRQDEYDGDHLPRWVFFSGHEDGKFVQVIKDKPPPYWTDNTHVNVYVSRFCHPSLPKIHRRFRKDYRKPIPTWEREILPLEKQEWCRYCGGWGNMGNFGFTTGPLGPYFKLGKDVTRLRKKLLK